ncbi:hypothetical protein AQV86_05200 [Nanohaloarchaea archaeon SG9]|nr:hypothetical protein AQV86_05200 [Nanohaloarchaea archaeon SG9]
MRVEKLLKRLKREFIKVNIIQASLDSIGLFLGLNLFTFLFSIELVSGVDNPQILLAFSVLFFIGDLIYRVKNYRLEIYEQENPKLKEVLRTARDNLDKSDIASQALFDDLMDRARSVTSDSIIPSKVIIQKILVVGGLSFMTALSGIADFQIQQNPTEVLSDVDNLIPGDNSVEEDGVDEVEFNDTSRILGEAENIDFNSEINISIQGEGNESEAGFEAYSGEEEMTFEAADPNRPDNLELARDYSLAIRDFE